MSRTIDGSGAPEPCDPTELEVYRGELRAHCRRILGSAFEAEDAAQEALLRAWCNLDRFEGRSSVRTWLYRIATNVCLDMLRRQGRAAPMAMSPSFPSSSSSSSSWSSSSSSFEGEPAARPDAPGGRGGADVADPADLAVSREALRLAIVATLRRLPAKQRAALILCEVLRWRSDEVADLLGCSVAAVNSALQRARATLAAADPPGPAFACPPAGEERSLLARYVDAFERSDVDTLVALVHPST